MDQKFIIVSGTVRSFAQQPFVDIPAMIRLDTQTGKTWFAEVLQGRGVTWVNVTESGDHP